MGFDDVEMVVNIRAAAAGTDNSAMSIARRRTRTGGDVKAALELLSMTRPVSARCTEHVQREYPHLAA